MQRNATRLLSTQIKLEMRSYFLAYLDRYAL